MGHQLDPQPTKQIAGGHLQYTLPLYTSKALQGYHLVVVMEDGHLIRQPFGLDSFFNSYAEFTDSGVLPHLIQILDIVYEVEPAGAEKSVWAQLEKNPDAEVGELHPTFWLAMNPVNREFDRPWFIRLYYGTETVCRSV